MYRDQDRQELKNPFDEDDESNNGDFLKYFFSAVEFNMIGFF